MGTPGIPAQNADQKSSWNPGKPIHNCFCLFKKLFKYGKLLFDHTSAGVNSIEIKHRTVILTLFEEVTSVRLKVYKVAHSRFF